MALVRSDGRERMECPRANGMVARRMEIRICRRAQSTGSRPHLSRPATGSWGIRAFCVLRRRTGRVPCLSVASIAALWTACSGTKPARKENQINPLRFCSVCITTHVHISLNHNIVVA